MRLFPTLLCFLFIIALLPGCSNVVGPKVKGQVLLDDQPVAGARVQFMGKGGSTAITDDDGKFFFDGTAFKTVQPGKYTVAISKYVDKKTGKAPDAEQYDDLLAAGKLKSSLPVKYAALEDNPLTAEIKEGDNDLPIFQLKSK